MTKAPVSILAAISVAALTASSAAYAHPGGSMGGGMGNGSMGVGGMGGGHDFSNARGADFPDNRATSRSDIDNSNRSMTSSSAPPTVLQRNTHVERSLSTSLTHSGISLPSGGLNAACAGYRTLGNCVAALHVAHNLGLPGGFTALKGLTTGPHAISLGAAVRQLRPSTDAAAAVRMANRQAKADLEVD
jgi:hypothetical protein